MAVAFNLCEGVVLHSFCDSSGSVFYNDTSGDILSVPLTVSPSEGGRFICHNTEGLGGKSVITPPEAVTNSIEQLVKRKWITLHNA
ncbi:hypothetical protein GTH32_17265 [Alteromonas sp. 345S023]|uniref:Uncharacterized protein n=1 Tax=Alteromonas profundi TaxID=2696062 RepID=A0A7X5LQM4_9ALTE|nr:hypothetical protein [Alteromonas profundi]NDV92920.1 hypothetical protein [Alteromonas profundi]